MTTSDRGAWLRSGVVIALAVGPLSYAHARGDDLGQPSTSSVVYDDAGEISVGAESPTRAAMMSVIADGTPAALRATLEYGERVECPECVPPLTRRLLESDDGEIRQMAAWWLRRRLAVALPVHAMLVETLQTDPDATKRARAAEAIGYFMRPRGIPALDDAIRDEGEAVEVRVAATRALGHLNHGGVGPQLAFALRVDATEVRVAALEAIAEARFANATELDPALLEQLEHADAGVRRAAANLLGQRRYAASREALGALLTTDASIDVREAAAIALGRIGGAEAVLTAARTPEQDAAVLNAIDIARAM